jgi:pyruvate formate lyase activating enzyme
MTTALLFDIRRYAIHDGPGIRTTVFFKGCPLRCAWCHNPESQSPRVELMLRPNRCISCGACAEACPNAAINCLEGNWVTDRARCTVCGKCVEACYAEARQVVGREYTVEEVMAVIERDRAFFNQSGGGVTFSGGEPLTQPDFLLELLRECKHAGLHTTLDTCGHAPWAQFERVLPYVDLVLYDLKLMDEAGHRRLTGASNALILENLQKLDWWGLPIWLRMPLIPGINDDIANLKAVAACAAGLSGRPPIHLLPYHNSAQAKYTGLGVPYHLPNVASPTTEQLQAASKRLAAAGLKVIIGG